MALKVLLSGQLAEGKLRIVDSEYIEQPKTKFVQKSLDLLGDQLITFVTEYKANPDFMIAQRNIKTLKVNIKLDLLAP